VDGHADAGAEFLSEVHEALCARFDGDGEERGDDGRENGAGRGVLLRVEDCVVERLREECCGEVDSSGSAGGVGPDFEADFGGEEGKQVECCYG